jgi:hypothetical protein
MLLIDAVLAVDEEELISFRIQYMSSLVDFFVIAESPTTFSGQPRDLIFSRMKKANLLDEKVIVEVIEIPPKLMMEPIFAKEFYVRNELANRVSKRFMGAAIMILDADEFPSREQLHEIKSLPSHPMIASVPMRLMFRRANWELKIRGRRLWTPPKVFVGDPPSFNLRAHPTSLSIKGEPGVHFSFLMMDSLRIEQKFMNYGHEEFGNRGLFPTNFMSYCDRYGLDHMGRGHREGLGLLDFISVSNLPEVARAAVEKKPKWFGDTFEGSEFERIIRAQFVRKYIVQSSTEGDPNREGWEPKAFQLPSVFFELMLSWAEQYLIRVRKRVRRDIRRALRSSKNIAQIVTTSNS